MKTPLTELIEWMEQNQYFIGNDLYAKQKELLEKKHANQQPEVDYQKMFANCKLPNEQPPKTVEERALNTIQSILNDGTFEVETFNESVLVRLMELTGRKVNVHRERRNIDKDFRKYLEENPIKGATDNELRDAAEKVVMYLGEYFTDIEASSYSKQVRFDKAVRELEKALAKNK